MGTADSTEPLTMLHGIVIASMGGCTLGMPQGVRQEVDRGTGPRNLFTKILSYDALQEGENFGHNLVQEDGIASGQRIGDDGLQYGFYTYLQEDGTRVRVDWRAGAGIGYEIISTEGIDMASLGNLKATLDPTPDPFYVETGPVTPNPNRAVNPVIIRQDGPDPVNTFVAPPVVDFDFAPNQFDYPSELNVQRSQLGYKSTFKATK